MKRFLLKKLDKYRIKLMKRISETTHEYESLFDKIVSLVNSSILYYWCCFIDSIVIRLESVLVCALFADDLDDGSSNAAFMRILKAMRGYGFDANFKKYLYKFSKQQRENIINDYDEHVKRVYERYTPADIINFAIAKNVARRII